MARYRKKPIVVEAEQFSFGKPLPHRDRGPIVCLDGTRWYVVTIHGERATLADDDWVVLEPDGKHAYPVKPDIFVATYEPVEGRDDGDV